MGQKTDYITEYITDLEVSEGVVSATGERPTIFKKVLTGYASIKVRTSAETSWVKSVPVFQMDAGEELEEFGLQLQKNEQIIAVTPPVKLTYGVWGLFPDASTTFDDFKTESYDLDLPVFLGFEFEHVEHQKWVTVYKKKLLKIFHVSRTFFDC